MLEIDVASNELYDEKTEKFIAWGSFKVKLEHSLISVSKWEGLWEQAFLGKKEKTSEQTLSYVKMMILDENVPPEVFNNLVNRHLEEVRNYINAPMTATKLPSSQNSQQSQETITTELIYYWMISLNIPVEFENWHLNRLITLIRVINLKNSPKKKMSLSERRNLNRQRLSRNNTQG
jgi:hypothetical protein